MSKLNLMCGIPGSGKSYWVRHHITDTDAYISRDQIRFSMLKEGEEYFSHENEVFEEFIAQIKNAINGNYNNIFVDATHLNKSSRNKLLYALGDAIEEVEEINLIFLNTPLYTALARNHQRTGRKYVPEETIRSMFKGLKLPDGTETNITSVYIIEEGKPIERRFINGK